MTNNYKNINENGQVMKIIKFWFVTLQLSNNNNVLLY